MRDWFHHKAQSRPGHPILHLYALPPADGPVADLINRTQDALLGSDQVSVVNQDALHMTIHQIDYSDQISGEQYDRLRRKLRIACSGLLPMTIELGPAQVTHSGVVLSASRPRAYNQIWTEVYRAVAEELGREHGWEPPRIPRPHLALAYGAVDADTARDVFNVYNVDPDRVIGRDGWTIESLWLLDAVQDPAARQFRLTLRDELSFRDRSLDEAVDSITSGFSSDPTWTNPPEWEAAVRWAMPLAAKEWSPSSYRFHEQALLFTAAVVGYAHAVDGGALTDQDVRRRLDALAPDEMGFCLHEVRWSTEPVERWLRDTLLDHGHTLTEEGGDPISSLWCELVRTAPPGYSAGEDTAVAWPYRLFHQRLPHVRQLLTPETARRILAF